VAGLLLDLLSPLDSVFLSLCLVRQGFLSALVTGDVLYLGAVGRVQLRRVDLTVTVGLDDREVRVDAETAVPGGVEHTEVLEYLLEFREKRPDLVGPAEVGLGDDLHERDAGAVVVDEGVVGGVDRATPVSEATGVLLEVCTTDTDRTALPLDGELEPTVLTDRLVVLGDLKVLR